MGRVWRRGAIVVLGVAVVLAAAAATILARSGRLPQPPTGGVPLGGAPALLAWPEHDAIYRAAAFPIVVEIEAGPGAVCHVGALHTSDPTDPQFGAIRGAFERFRPTVVLLEGRQRLYEPPMLMLNGTSEVGFTFALARREGIGCFTLEPRYEDEVAGLLDRWPAEAVACYVVSRRFVGEGGPEHTDPASVIARVIGDVTDVDGLRGVLDGVEAFENAWRSTVGDGADWRTISGTERVPELRLIGDTSREIRGRHMVDAIATLALRGERVLAVVGASHVIRQEPMLRWAVTTRTVTE